MSNTAELFLILDGRTFIQKKKKMGELLKEIKTHKLIVSYNFFYSF